ncbi:MAG: cellobiose phosphorylase, partial [Candidatus Omnitrophica bacterium]|nr:cellobiose phosphorylase [Candidatus Omnitrophota bacterium]
DDKGTFICENPEQFSRLYFPLANEAEFMSSITPSLKGDIKTGQNSFLLAPVTSEDLHNQRLGRNFWIYLNKNKIWSLSQSDEDKVTLKAGLLWHEITRTNRKIGLKTKILNFVPATGERVEIMQVEITNISGKTIEFSPTAAIPIYGRSADNLRDHRHVTSLLNRIQLHKYGLINKPTMTFDERGHRLNHTSYYVLGFRGNSEAPSGFFPAIETFIGEGGNLDRPKAIIENLPPQKNLKPGDQGKECLAGLRFSRTTLKPGTSATFSLLLGIAEEPGEINKVLGKFGALKKIENSLAQTKEYWINKIDQIEFFTGDKNFDNWLRWVKIQPVLRRIYGCSFLPDFDYGRGGKGWRDLWQDCLALILSEPTALRDLLIANFAGVRVDGSNATIITKKPGYFIADRNRLARTWMDHGVWPYFTLELYIHQTQDLNILFEKTSYFKDQHLDRASGIDHQWDEKHKHLITKKGLVYHGSLLEHILVQHLTQFFNVGRHNNIRLEGADWNDGLDMARHNGESVAFTAFYAYNLKNLARLLEKISQTKKIKNVRLFKELLILLKPVGHAGYKAKQKQLAKYFSATREHIEGETINMGIDRLIADLNAKADWIFKHIRGQEWLKVGFFNGYYDDSNRRVEGKLKNGVRMTLTGQVFALLSRLASEEQANKVFRSAKKFLKDGELGGFRLNSDFKELKLDLGRAFGFSYGEKENGSFFSHMNVMFAYALYERERATEGFEVLNSIYKMAANLKLSKIYPTIPEYFNSTGRGMYPYLTGSASWYILTLLTQVFGIRGEYGELVINPKFVSGQFKASKTLKVAFNFAGKRFSVCFHNPRALSYPHYKINKVEISGPKIKFSFSNPQKIVISRSLISGSPLELISLNISLN